MTHKFLKGEREELGLELGFGLGFGREPLDTDSGVHVVSYDKRV